ncbi:uncharacterized protein UV8b_03585 [Ustilaginoidea virens]|uniref:Uncharacterized protein n=1 Tax=Ustilaginoidea virens TaxID=1159556 RepID=A0A063C4D3_USTVR|nr:uncharacterized protein UV8b_03585 [Ustilaginoidea virens]QUC19344.1 hypothetical protein UV8b_03585 [Ustilaginoidea virens]GAO13179.1 hypothetical protein UVI_02025340 [Ustilaginoidea virens]
MATASPTSQVPTWLEPTSEEAEDLDEPPERKPKFGRTAVRQPQDHASLLTKAIMGETDESPARQTHSILNSQRRRSMTSNISVASTADLTSDTGMTSPCRTSTPSPPIPEMAALRLHHDVYQIKKTPAVNATAPQLPQPPKKRCIQFACAAMPPIASAQPMVKSPSEGQAGRRPSIKFACPERPASTQNTPPKLMAEAIVSPSLPTNPESPSTPRKPSALPAACQNTPRSSTRRPSDRAALHRPKFLRANSVDLVKDSSQFHEFASDIAREEDWIRQPPSAVATRLTIDDTLSKENHFRRIGAEAEEEAEMEEKEDEEATEDDEDLDAVDEDDDIEDDIDQDEDGGNFEEDSDGYHTDSESGFAESDEEEEQDENMMLWTPSHATVRNKTVVVAPIRRLSLHEPQSDSSAASGNTRSSMRRLKVRRSVKIRSSTPDLPDSTDFVCGTLDEDRPLEEAYLSCLAARRSEKLRVIPQDIDPSFPASDPDNDEDEDIYNPVLHESDENVWVQGKMEDLHHGQQDRCRRRKKTEQASPRKYRSPAPAARRHHSPAPKARGRSPKPLFGRHSPRRPCSPAPRGFNTPSQTPRQGPHVQFHLAGRPGMTMTKSLPRPPAIFTAMKGAKTTKHQHVSDCHLRGAIDIVKGLEHKRQRRKEKFFQKYCNRARRGQIPERKPQPGRGAERMKELGLLMAGKKDQGNYVLSV